MITKSEERCLPTKEHSRRITTRPQLCCLFSKYLLLQRHSSAQFQENCNSQHSLGMRHNPSSPSSASITAPVRLDSSHATSASTTAERDLCPIISVCVQTSGCHTAHSWRGKDKVMTNGMTNWTVKSSVNTSRGAKARGSPPSPWRKPACSQLLMPVHV